MPDDGPTEHSRRSGREHEALEALGCASRGDASVLRARVPQTGLVAAVAALRAAREQTPIRHPARIHEIPTRAAIASILEGHRAVLFPSHFGGVELDEERLDFFVGSTLHRMLAALREEARRALAFTAEHGEQSDAALLARADRFVDEVRDALPTLRRLAVEDLEALRAIDTTGAPLSELLVCDPGVRALLTHRLARVLHDAGISLLARLAAEVAREQTGITIAPTARLGPRIAIVGPASIGAGVVIEAGSVIDERARIGDAR